MHKSTQCKSNANKKTLQAMDIHKQIPVCKKSEKYVRDVFL